MSEFDYQQINDIIHSRLRLAIMSVLITVTEAEFNFIKAKINATDGNLSVQIRKLEEAGYVTVKKEFMKRKPRTMFMLTNKGKKAFEAYVDHISKLINM